MNASSSSSSDHNNHNTRIIIKNLPNYLTVDRLRDHFGKRGGIITDAKLAKTSEGVSRRFGFIGFKSEKDAKDAVNYFNNTFIDTSRIQVDFARSVADPNLPRPWSRYSEGSTAHQQLQDLKNQREQETRIREVQLAAKQNESKTSNLISDLKAAQQDPKLQEFLEVMRPRNSTKSRTWANDDGMPGAVAASNLKSETTTTTKSNLNSTLNDDDDDEDEDDDGFNDLSSLRKNKVSDINDDTEDNNIAKDSKVSDMEYFRSRMKSSFSDDNDDYDDDEDDMAGSDNDDDDIGSQMEDGQGVNKEVSLPKKNKDGKKSKPDPVGMEVSEAPASNTLQPAKDDSLPARALLKTGTEELPAAEVIADTGRLFVKNLSYMVTEVELKELFGKFGPLSEIHISIDKETKKPKGYAFILFLIPEHALNAYIALDHQIFQGRILEILPGKEKPQAPDEVELNAVASFKKKLEQKRKKHANNEFSWNSLFMNSDSVAEAMAKKLGVRKAEILDPASESLAVRLALAETDIISETKEYFEQEGLNISAFEGAAGNQRSNTAVIVKNIPSTTTFEDLEGLFSPHSTLGRVLLPPSRTIAIIEFLEPNEAKLAFRRLAYSRFKGLPLFLEYAPQGIFKESFDKEKEEKRLSAQKANELETNTEADIQADDSMEEQEPNPAASTSKPSVKTSGKKAIIKDSVASKVADDEADDADAMPVATLFVKNLNFSTQDGDLKKLFENSIGRNSVRSVRIARKQDPKKAGALLSMGFGFVEFHKKDDAIQAVKVLQGVELDGHTLQLKFSNVAAKVNANTKKSGKNQALDHSKPVPGTKLIIRNIPFEATKNDIRQLFSTFGQVKSVRLPRKFDGTHRGFGFVDFLTKQEAKAAFKTLGSTHLYGRHLVMEWAAEEEGNLEALRTKTARGFYKDDDQPNKRKRIEIGATSVSAMDQDE